MDVSSSAGIPDTIGQISKIRYPTPTQSVQPRVSSKIQTKLPRSLDHLRFVSMV